MGIPNGPTISQGVTVTLGNEQAQVDVSGAEAVPSDGGTPWALGSPGNNTFAEGNFTPDGSVGILPSQSCDLALYNTATGALPDNTICGTAPANSSVDEQLDLFAPTSSTDTSSTWTITTTWTAVSA